MTEQKQGMSGEELDRTRVTASELSWALRAVNRANAEVEHELARRLGLRQLDLTAMTHLIDSPHPIGPAELGERVGISSGSATELVDRLERAGHLVRTAHPSDRRRVALEPTTAAIGRLLRELRPLLEALDQLAEQFSEGEQASIQRYLRGVEQHLNHYLTGQDSPRN